MLEIAVIKTAPQSSEAPSQNARKAVDRDQRDDNAETFEKEYETASDRSKTNRASDETNVEKHSDTSGKSSATDNAVENPKARANSTPLEDTVDTDETGTDIVVAEPHTEAAAAEIVSAHKREASAVPAAGLESDNSDGEVQLTAALAEAPASKPAPVDTSAQDAERKAPPKPSQNQGGSTAESIVMSKALEGTRAQIDKTVPVGAKDKQPVERVTATSSVSQVKGGENVPQAVPPTAVAKSAATEKGQAKEKRPWRSENLQADLPAQVSHAKTTDPLRTTPPALPPQPVKVDAAREKTDPLSIAALDTEGLVTSETRSTSTSSPQSLAQILSRPETPSMIARQMAEVLQRLPDRPVEISLSPKELGRVRMNISAVETGITVSVLAERPETLDLMRRNIDQLVREFQAIGYENINFAFSEGEAKQQFADNQSDTAGTSETVTRLDLTPMEDTAGAADPVLRTGGIDIRL